jgi:predicted glutamine amidotransferase
MCVIIVAQKRLPNEEELRRAWSRNDDGAGVSWVSRRGKVVWVKGLMRLEDVLAIRNEVRLPCVWHFRSATHGGVSQALTHPFLISPKAPFSNPLKGTLKDGESLLFHNGVEGQAISNLINLLAIKNLRLDDTVMSDSRAIAISISLVGEVVLTLYHSKFAIVRSDGTITVQGNFTEEDGLLVSTPLRWEVDFVRWTRRGGYGGYGGCGLEL